MKDQVLTLTPVIENSNIKIAKITKHIQIVDESKFLIFVMIKNPLCYITNILFSCSSAYSANKYIFFNDTLSINLLVYSKY